MEVYASVSFIANGYISNLEQLANEEQMGLP